MPVSTAALKQIAAVGGIISLGGAAYFYKRIQDNVASGSYYSKTLEIIRQHNGATEVLGLPIKTKFVDLGNKFNGITALQANLAIPVRGAVRQGTLYTWSSRASMQDDWSVQRIDLEVNNPRRRVTIYVAPSGGESESADQSLPSLADQAEEIGDR
ncbi:cytochrome c oxidase assembly factor 1 homolog [Diadema setosum]|uniref:cytochrome c oxidase assembly factor 1 homolog n=1 Tax=Diadema setosum TaxID=31175 RepID=UPI003B3BDBFA